MTFQTLTMWLAPYRLSWLAILVFGGAAVCFWHGRREMAGRGRPVGAWRTAGFTIGLLLCYAVLHTRLDYLSQYMFFFHRGQHLVLHHLGPFLIALSNPWATLWAGLPESRLKQRAAALAGLPSFKAGYRLVQNTVVAPVLFVGLIYLWLWPEVHFDAMLSQPLYLLMNWSMLIDGLLFWGLVLDPRHPKTAGTIGFGGRILMLWAVTVPQLALGAYITFSRHALYDIYTICGRVWPIAPETDQVIGGLLTWIPPGMMAVIAMVVVLRRLLASAGPVRSRPFYVQG